MRLAMLIELDRCIGCLACVSACKEQWDSGDGAARDWVRTVEYGTRESGLGLTFYPGLCMQCETHPCTEGCPTGATFVDERGVVRVDPKVCIGCGSCIPACPYGARHADPVKGIVEKCDLCTPRLDRGEQPACVQTCLAECRHVGDLDDPTSDVARRIRETGARPLATAEIDVKPRTAYAGDRHREAILAHGDALRPPRPSGLEQVWSLALPLTRFVVPSIAVAAVAGGAAVNLLAARRTAVAAAEGAEGAADHGGPPDPAVPATLPRHRLGMRLLHWFNAVSWLFLILTGTALMAQVGFALFGTSLPAAVAGAFGGASGLLGAHVVWGLVWAGVIVPTFLLYKEGGLEALHEIRLTRADVRWLLLKPLALLGKAREPLPPQDKYNAGQKIFALSALAGTTLIIASGLVMTFHIGPAPVVAAAIVVHLLAIALALAGLAVHITMAAILREERPALRSMITGHVDREFAEHHSTHWVRDHDRTHRGEDTKK